MRFIQILFIIAIEVLLSVRSLGQSKIDTLEKLTIGGIKQVVKIEGQDRTLPLFLFITGGPGSEGIYPENHSYLDELKKYFTVVTWDQRNCGQTLKLNVSPVKLTVKLYENDTHELVTKLLDQFHQKKLFIMGWSWGTVLGFYMADKHPEQLYAYMAVSPAVNQWQSERILLSELKHKAVAQKNKRAVTELAQVRIPFENGLQNYYDRKWLALLNGESIGDTLEFKKYFTENSEMTELFREASFINLTKSLPAVDCPVYFFVGKKDHQTNYSISEQYYKQLKAPLKDLFWFERSGHLIPVDEPAKMQDVVIKKVLPRTKLLK